VNVLDKIVADKRGDVAVRIAAQPLPLVRDAARGTSTPRDFAGALRAGAGVSVIAEIKRRSPSKGPLRADLTPADLATTYARHGAAALSVLTESRYFGGSDDDLIAARAVVSLPVLRKDFTVDEYQIHEARAIGADAILLIARVLTRDELARFLETARECRLAALVEVHDERELGVAVDCGAKVLGVNNRNLDTFEVSLETCLRLKDRIPGDRIAVAESGIHTAVDVRLVAEAGYDAVLVGESLLVAADPGAKLDELRRETSIRRDAGATRRRHDGAAGEKARQPGDVAQ
jgi:indole-3-glycerol phosphate synthase